RYCLSKFGYFSIISFESWQHFSALAAAPFFEQAPCQVSRNSFCFWSCAFCSGLDCAWAFRGISTIMLVSIASAVIRMKFFMMNRSSRVFFDRVFFGITPGLLGLTSYFGVCVRHIFLLPQNASGAPPSMLEVLLIWFRVFLRD